MQQMISGVGTAVGVAGLLVCLAAMLLRLAGNFYFMGAELSSLLLGGIALLVGGSFLKLHALGMTRGN